MSNEDELEKMRIDFETRIFIFHIAADPFPSSQTMSKLLMMVVTS